MLWIACAKRFFTTFVVLLFFSLGLQTGANAGMINSEQLILSEQLNSDKQQLKTWMAREDVREQLVDMGVDVDLAILRVDSMSADEVQQLSTNMQELPVGSGFAETLVLAFIVLVILEVTGVTDVLPNI